jgi:N-acetylglucosamine malate deacetylase 1
MANRALVIASHPDDAEIMVGGTIAVLVAAGWHVAVANLTVSERTPAARRRRMSAAEDAAGVLGFEAIWVAGGRYDQVTDIAEHECVRLVDEVIDRVAPDVVFTHCLDDFHADHVRAARASIAAIRRSQANFYAFGPSDVRTHGCSAFRPHVLVDISAYAELKRSAIACYNLPGTGYRPLNADAILTMNAGWGIAAGTAYAEALQVTRSYGIGFPALGAPPSAGGAAAHPRELES